MNKPSKIIRFKEELNDNCYNIILVQPCIVNLFSDVAKEIWLEKGLHMNCLIFKVKQ